MRLKITHRTEYSYDSGIGYALQRLRLVPRSGNAQTVRSWTLAIEGGREEVRFTDQFGNETRLLSVDTASRRIVVEASGEVETFDMNGVTGPHRGFAPLWLFQRQTALTAPGEGVAATTAGLDPKEQLAMLHSLMDRIADSVAYETGITTTLTTAEEAIALKRGVCQDHAHIFIAGARQLGFPARYVSGYLLMDGIERQVASHAWAEAHVDALGWVAFDTANRQCPDDRYVRLATGLDYRDAAPVSGIRLGLAKEDLAVDITVEQ